MSSFQPPKARPKTHELALAIYRLTLLLPKDERFGLCSQLRRAAVSAAANLAEGRERGTDADLAPLFDISAGSVAQTQCYPVLARDLDHLTDAEIAPATSLAAEALRLIKDLRETLRSAPAR